RRHTRSKRDWSSDVCSSDLEHRCTVVPSLLGRPGPGKAGRCRRCWCRPSVPWKPRVGEGRSGEKAVHKVLISACLMGRKVRFDGRATPADDDLLDPRRAEARLVRPCPEAAAGVPVPRPAAGADPLDGWRAEERLVVHCPEVAGGLPVPRPPAEIEPGAGAAEVLTGRARILTPDGGDVTHHFVAGARAALNPAHTRGVGVAVLKEASPSCGLHEHYDGTFTGAKDPGPGVTAQLLLEHGIAVFNETELARAQEHLDELDKGRVNP